MATTEDRVSRLEGAYQYLATKEDVAEVRGDVAGVRGEMATKEDVAEVRTDVANARADFKGEINKLMLAVLGIGGGLLAVATAALLRDVLS